MSNRPYNMGAAFTLAIMLVSGSVTPSGAQSIYRNYADGDYQRISANSSKTKYYDLFGEHIVDGFVLFEMLNREQGLYGSGVGDSVAERVFMEHQHSSLVGELDALCLSQDNIGKSKMLFMVGDRLHTKFTPLTFNKRNYGGLRWDLWSSGLKMTTLLTRTRPGILAHSVGGYKAGYAIVSYPMLDFDNDDIDDWYAYDHNPGTGSGDFRDWSQKTFFGDYDLLFALHAENNLANIVNVGVTYINHHRSDIANGEKFFSGDLPDRFSPREIHFEVADMTADVTDDAGALVRNMTMFINGRDAGGPDAVYRIVDGYMVNREGTRGVYDTLGYFLVPDMSDVVEALPETANGSEGLVITFKPLEMADSLGFDSTEIRDVSFTMTVAGNYQVFSSCELLTPQDDDHRPYDIDGDSVYFTSGTNTVEYVYDEISGGLDDYSDNKRRNLKLNSDDAEVYYGDYCARAPYPVQDYSNIRTLEYRFQIPVSTVTYGVNFNGKLGAFSYNGEYAVSIEESKVPYTNGVRDTVHMHAGYLQLKYSLNDYGSVFSDIYNIDADYHSGLGSFYVSPFFNLRPQTSLESGMEPMYFVYPRVLDNEYTLVDDNDDDDFYVENDRRRLPGESSLPGALYEDIFYGDGTVKAFADASNKSGDTKIRSILEKRVKLPTGLYRYYDDHDGVVSPVYDQNRNGLLDYQEDFLLYRADIPVFRLEKDMNNNGIYDIEEDDFLPDYPYQTGQAYVGNDVKSLGIRGISGGADLRPWNDLYVQAGGVYEKILDLDFDEHEQGLHNGVGLNRTFYLRGTYDRMLRSAGIAYGAGLEVKRTWDGIRNDAVITHNRFGDVKTDVDYTLQTDDLRYFNALAGVFTGDIDYRKIPNLEVKSEAAVGYERHYAVDEPLLLTRSYEYNPEDQTSTLFPGMYYFTTYEEADYIKRNATFRTDYVEYGDLNANALHWRLKGGYTFKFTKERRGRYSRYLNVLQQLRIIPRYQIYYVNKSSDQDDPRDGIDVNDTTVAIDTLGQKFLWNDYRRYNEHVLYNVPMLQMTFKIGERTMLEFGYQLMNATDFMMDEESYAKRSLAAQVVNRTTLQGYEVAIIMGLQRMSVAYKTLGIDDIFGFGHAEDQKTTSVFCKIYAGLKQQ